MCVCVCACTARVFAFGVWDESCRYVCTMSIGQHTYVHTYILTPWGQLPFQTHDAHES